MLNQKQMKTRNARGKEDEEEDVGSHKLVRATFHQKPLEGGFL